jgi:hypothetical protein
MTRRRHAPAAFAASQVGRHGDQDDRHARAGQAQLPWQGTDPGARCDRLGCMARRGFRSGGAGLPAGSARRRLPPGEGACRRNTACCAAIPKTQFPAPIASSRSKPPRAAMSARAPPFRLHARPAPWRREQSALRNRALGSNSVTEFPQQPRRKVRSAIALAFKAAMDCAPYAASAGLRTCSEGVPGTPGKSP